MIVKTKLERNGFLGKTPGFGRLSPQEFPIAGSGSETPRFPGIPGYTRSGAFETPAAREFLLSIPPSRRDGEDELALFPPRSVPAEFLPAANLTPWQRSRDF